MPKKEFWHYLTRSFCKSLCMDELTQQRKANELIEQMKEGGEL